MVVPQSDGRTSGYSFEGGNQGLACEDGTNDRKSLLALLLLGPALAGCSGRESDLLSKDADWFSRSGRTFIRNVSIETPPLTPEQAGDAG